MMDSITYSAFTVLSRFLRRLSPNTIFRLRDRLASFLFHHVPLRKALARQQLEAAFPEYSPERLDGVIRNLYRHFTGEFLNFILLPQSYHAIRFRVEGQAYLDQARQQGQGTLLITGHWGSWELLAAWLGHNGYATTAVANRQSNQGANQFFREQRETGAIDHIYNKRGTSTLKKVLKSNRILLLASDQDARRNGVFVDFFERPASTPRGAAVFHRRLGTPLVFGTCHATGWRTYTIRFAPLHIPDTASINQIVQSYTSRLEAAIRTHPEQYFWFHRRWKTRPKASQPA
ncbi:MAG: lysophospholipid acyltransferase family protein [FCB group bacterium]|nr:lysophospholipid acyltransferase family protein [FCB group bacterium]